MNYKYKSIKNYVKAVINEIDPEDLLDVAPEDEYNDYINQIVSLIINKKNSEKELSLIWKKVNLEKIKKMYLRLKQYENSNR
jgi:6-pyruvoyl-tetrahydropterin synthase